MQDDRGFRTGVTVLFAALTLCATGGMAGAQERDPNDPRIGLSAGWYDAGTAISNLELVASVKRPEGFFNPAALGDLLLANSDLAFRGETLFLGSFHGFNIYDISDPADPRLRTSFPCPGGQGDLSVHGNLLFMSVEMPNGRVDCGPTGTFDAQPSAERFRGVRIFDVSDLSRPRQVAAVQTCRGSHTHTLVTDPGDQANVYIYVSGTSTVRPAEEMAGCSGRPPGEDPNTSYFLIEVIRVPVAAPQDARIINAPRIFADAATGDMAGLWRGGDHGPGTQTTSTTDQCHDITAYPAIGLAAGACSGNGILLDISDPANPVRLAEVIDPNFAYWHSATFNNTGTRVIFTDEWGGGTAARCREKDDPKWGANAIFERQDRVLTLRGYYKLPVPQTEQENCVAHNGSMIPVPGRDIMVQAWYQGGISIFDFTDPSNPFEIAYFDRGPMSATELLTSGFWAAYWYNGRIYASEIGRGLDVFEITPSEHLTQNEIDAAKSVQLDEFNPQTQPRFAWAASYSVARVYVDQVGRRGIVPEAQLAEFRTGLDRAEATQDARQRQQLLARLSGSAAGHRIRIEQAGGAAASDVQLLDQLSRTLMDLSRN